MPTGYAGEGSHYSKKLGRWVKKENEKAFDYDGLDLDAAGFVVSFFRYYPDYYADLCRSPNAQYKLELPQRIMLRVNARYRKVYITGTRGLTKTYIVILERLSFERGGMATTERPGRYVPHHDHIRLGIYHVRAER